MLPRAIATRDAFENAVALDVAMGGSTNTVLHLLAAAREAELDFGVADIDAISRRVPCLSQGRARTRQKYHMEDVHRAGGIPAILGELDRGGLLHRDVHAVHAPDAATSWLADLGHPRRLAVRRGASSCSTRRRAACAPPSRSRTTNRWSTLDTDAADGCIRDVAHAYTADGGLAILFGNLAPDGCVVKTAGVDEELWQFRGPAKVFESQEDAVDAILGEARSSPATWSSSATRGRAAGRACRRCSTRRRSSRAAGSARRAR